LWRAESRDAIVDAAIDNFSRLGYRGTSIRDIRGADMTPASIYHHFPSKQRIMKNVLEDVITKTTAVLMDSRRSATQQLDAVVRTWVLYHTDNRAQALIGASEIRRVDEARRPATRPDTASPSAVAQDSAMAGWRSNEAPVVSSSLWKDHSSYRSFVCPPVRHAEDHLTVAVRTGALTSPRLS
jgi:AcrR family transcriptional regulator